MAYTVQMARPRSFDEQTVLDAAMRQFRLTGYAGTTLDDLSAATGLGRGSLYASFSGKHPLFLRALTTYAEQGLPALERFLAGPDESAVDRLREFLVGSAHSVLDDAELKGCMAGQFAHEVGARDAKAAPIIRDTLLGQQCLVAACAEAAQRSGDIEPSADPMTIGGLVISLTRGFDIMAKAGIDRDTLDAAAHQAFTGLPLTSRYRERHSP